MSEGWERPLGEGNFSYPVLLGFYYYWLVLEKKGVGVEGFSPAICDLKSLIMSCLGSYSIFHQRIQSKLNFLQSIYTNTKKPIKEYMRITPEQLSYFKPELCTLLTQPIQTKFYATYIMSFSLIKCTGVYDGFKILLSLVFCACQNLSSLQEHIF